MLLIEFECREYRFAVPLSFVDRVVPSAQPVPLPGAPDLVLGVLNLGGEIAIVINFFQRIGLVLPAIELEQQLLLIDVAGLKLALIVDRVLGVVTRNLSEQTILPSPYPAAEYVQGIVQLDDGLSIICDPQKFLLDSEKTLLKHVLENQQHAVD